MTRPREQIPRRRESAARLPLKGGRNSLFSDAEWPRKDLLHKQVEICGEREEDMARNKSGKRGSAIIVLMAVAAIAGSPSTAAASTSPRPLVSPPAAAPVLALQAPVFGFERASWAEASWAEE